VRRFSVAKATTLVGIVDEAYKEAELTRDDILNIKGYLSSGNLALDAILGGKGWPMGRSIELFGLSMSGKTTIAATAAAVCQSMGKPVLYIDFEQALDRPYLESLGVNTEDRRLFLPYPAGSLDEGMELATRAARTGELGLIVCDSVGAMIPRSMAESDVDSRTLAMERARILGAALGKLNPILSRTGTTALFINHERDVIETGPVRPGLPKRTTTAGGSALKYLATVRIKFKVIEATKHKRFSLVRGEEVSEPHAALVFVEVTKNKLAPPFQTAHMYLEFGYGFNNAHAALTVLVGSSIIRKTGAFYYFPEDLKHSQMSTSDKGSQLQGVQAVLTLADEDPSWRDRLVDRARAVLQHTETPTPVQVEAVAEIGEEPREPEVFVPRRTSTPSGVLESPRFIS
jgi:recombination protein RecA